jgi:hypothetical protein
MTKDEILEELIKRKIIIKKGAGYIFPVENQVVTKCKNLPEHYSGISGRQAMELFFIDAKIPDFSGGSLNYTLKTINEKSIKIFLNILKDNSIDFRILLAQTSNYFNSKTTVKPSMAKYFIEGTWKIVYNSYETGLKDLSNTVWR